MSPAKRLALVVRRFGSAARLAATIGKTRQTVSRTLAGTLRGVATQKAIAAACAVSRSKMFGPSSQPEF